MEEVKSAIKKIEVMCLKGEDWDLSTQEIIWKKIFPNINPGEYQNHFPFQKMKGNVQFSDKK